MKKHTKQFLSAVLAACNLLMCSYCLPSNAHAAEPRRSLHAAAKKSETLKETACVAGGVLLGTALLGALLYYNNSNKTSHERPGVRGIPNLGNTCYINALTQFLYSIFMFKESLRNESISDDDDNSRACDFFKEMFHLIDGPNCIKSDDVRQLHLKYKDRNVDPKYGPLISGKLQQDPAPLLERVFSNWNESIVRVQAPTSKDSTSYDSLLRRSGKTKELDAKQVFGVDVDKGKQDLYNNLRTVYLEGYDKAMYGWINDYLSKNGWKQKVPKGLFVNIFLYYSTLQEWLDSKDESTDKNKELYDCVNALPPDVRTYTLDDFKNMIFQSKFPGLNEDQANRVKKYPARSAEEMNNPLDVKTLPGDRGIVFHLNRARVGVGNVFYKNRNFMDWPDTIEVNGVQFSLNSFVVHRGSGQFNDGPYATYRKVNGKFLLFNHGGVFEDREFDVKNNLNQNATLVYYSPVK